VIGVLVVMIVPMNPIILDLLLSLNITFSLIILLVALYTIKPLEFSVFPSLLLVITIFRLSLNVASTRLILLHGSEGISAAGQVIKSFGSFVVGGNYVVGIVIFSILILINFVVITKGAGRIAEVAARFTLDAMPGKQMSIDADLSAGIINEDEARKRRQILSAEADFYGAMDGASKFVRGDAIAGVVIVFINILGGLIIGVLQQKMSIGLAAQNYTILTVGDGLVSQIPALIVSTAAGMIVTRANAESNLGKDLSQQILLHPRAIAIASFILLSFGLVPGLPKTPFFFLSLVSGAIAYVSFKVEKESLVDEKQEEGIDHPAQTQESVESLLPLDILELEIGYGLISLVDTEQDGDLLARIKSIRNHFAVELGLIVPAIHIRDNLNLKPSAYSILLKGNEIGSGDLMMNRYLAMKPGEEAPDIEGINTYEPAFGLSAKWILDSDKQKALSLGYTVVDSCTVLTTHLTEIIRSHAHELLGRQDVQKLLDSISARFPKLVDELIPNQLSLGTIHKVLQNLLKEKLPIRDLVTILETLADYAPMTKDQAILTEYVRQALSRTITKQYQSEDGTLPLVTLDHKLEEAIVSGIQRTEQGEYLALDPHVTEKIITNLNKVLERVVLMNFQPIIMCSPTIRRHVKRLTEYFLPQLVVLSPNEITNTKIKSLGVVSLYDGA
ncbi:MAG: flagellar biosynthesis protein FlhA, partial [Thermodesulfobacteriota bacterium]|nr:flagellar biosynthesis protein FlhA [Thermodesulfobacteriota bacterium]